MEFVSSEEKVNRVIKALKDAGYNNLLETDGIIGKEAIIACGRFLEGKDQDSEENINLVITALYEARFNSELIADGDIGKEAVKAIKRFISSQIT